MPSLIVNTWVSALKGCSYALNCSKPEKNDRFWQK